jgi:uracil phosphoribosyltransferase
MLDGFLQAVPYAKTALIGMKRDEETFEGIQYLYSLPETNEKSIFFVLDVMLATGVSLSESLHKLQNEKHKEIRILNVLATPEGIERISNEFPNVQIYTVSIDRELNDKKYILPGLGDAGDRIFGTL